MRVNYAIVFVSDMGRSVSFYRDTIGLPLRFESPHWTEFATDGATLALHLAESSPPLSAGDGPRAGSCRPGLQVPSLDEFTSGCASVMLDAFKSRRMCSDRASRIRGPGRVDDFRRGIALVVPRSRVAFSLRAARPPSTAHCKAVLEARCLSGPAATLDTCFASLIGLNWSRIFASTQYTAPAVAAPHRRHHVVHHELIT